MNKLLTAKEFLKEAQENPSKGWTVEKTMIEFAKLHVKAAVECCIEDASSGSSTDPVYYEDVVEALKDSYPLDYIK